MTAPFFSFYLPSFQVLDRKIDTILTTVHAVTKQRAHPALISLA